MINDGRQDGATEHLRLVAREGSGLRPDREAAMEAVTKLFVYLDAWQSVRDRMRHRWHW